MATDREKAIEHRNTALQLNKAWGVGAKQGRYRDTGDWYMRLERFPAAYFDPNGYVRFATKEEYLSIDPKKMKVAKQVWLPKGIAALPGYVRVRDDGIWAERRLEILRALAPRRTRRHGYRVAASVAGHCFHNKRAAGRRCETAGILFSAGPSVAPDSEVCRILRGTLIHHRCWPRSPKGTGLTGARSRKRYDIDGKILGDYPTGLAF